MDSVKVTVKWGSQKYENVDLQTTESPALFKAQLFSLTGVQPERQKILLRGKKLNDNSWKGFPVENGSVLFLLGTTDSVPCAPAAEEICFADDVKEEDVIMLSQGVKGMENLGNTCYMNATLQCLFTIPELVDALKKISLTVKELDSSTNSVLVNVWKETYLTMLDDKTSVVVPKLFLFVLHGTHPQFATKSKQGFLDQHDANELWLLLLRAADLLPGTLIGLEGSSKSVVSTYMSGTFEIEMRCTELDDPVAEVEKSDETFFQLSCYLNTEMKHLMTGLRAKMTENVTKMSQHLKRNANFEKRCLISRLPKYLTVQMVRFFYKEKDNISAKILKDVKFPIELDVYELCTPQLQKKLNSMRETFQHVEESKISSVDDKNENVEKKLTPCSFEDDVGSNNSGKYVLQAVLTHKGRTNDSGHYVAWVKSRRTGKWIMCDDDHVSVVSEEDILRLSGGGDWHCAYVLLYTSKVVLVDQA